MARKGGLSAKFYRETAGIKVTGGQTVKAGTMLTRQGDKWKPGLNVVGRMHLTSIVAGQVYFTHKRNTYGNAVTVVNVRSVEAKAPKAKTVTMAMRTAKASKAATKADVAAKAAAKKV
jgi:ribosomal protein L27